MIVLPPPAPSRTPLTEGQEPSGLVCWLGKGKCVNGRVTGLVSPEGSRAGFYECSCLDWSSVVCVVP